MVPTVVVDPTVNDCRSACTATEQHATTNHTHTCSDEEACQRQSHNSHASSSPAPSPWLACAQRQQQPLVCLPLGFEGGGGNLQVDVSGRGCTHLIVPYICYIMWVHYVGLPANLCDISVTDLFSNTVYLTKIVRQMLRHNLKSVAEVLQRVALNSNRTLHLQVRGVTDG